MKLNEFFAGLLITPDAVCQAFIKAALPDLTDAAIAYLSAAASSTAIAIDIFRTKNQTEFFRIQSRSRGPSSIIIVLSGQKGGAARAVQSTIRHHF